MNSIKPALAEVYADLIVPLARMRRQRGDAYFALAPDASVDTYWQAPTCRGDAQVHPVAPACDDVAGLQAALERMWTERGDGPLVRILPRLLDLRFDAEGGEQSGDGEAVPSDFVYPLF